GPCPAPDRVAPFASRQSRVEETHGGYNMKHKPCRYLPLSASDLARLTRILDPGSASNSTLPAPRRASPSEPHREARRARYKDSNSDKGTTGSGPKFVGQARLTHGETWTSLTVALRESSLFRS